MLSDGGNENGEKKTTIGLISKKATFARAAHFSCTFLSRCFARIQRETSRNFLVTLFWRKCCTCSRSPFFHCRSFLPCIGEGREGGYQIPVPSLNLAQIPVPRLIFSKIPVAKSKIPLLMIIYKIMRIIN